MWFYGKCQWAFYLDVEILKVSLKTFPDIRLEQAASNCYTEDNEVISSPVYSVFH